MFEGRTCKTCAAFRSDGDGTNNGECRRNPPRSAFSAWPFIQSDDWCLAWISAQYHANTQKLRRGADPA